MSNVLQIQFTPIYCYLQEASPEVDMLLYDFLSYETPGFFYAPKFQNGQWDGKKRLYSVNQQRFRTGLLLRVLEFLTMHNINYEVLDYPAATSFTQRNTQTYTLRNYQRDIINKILDYRFGIVQSPPRSGKTVIMLATIDSERQFPSIYFCRSLDLATQTVEKARMFVPDIPIGLIANGEADIKMDGLNICTIQSVYSIYRKEFPFSKGEKHENPLIQNQVELKKLLRTAKSVFYDENHHAKGDTSKFILEKCVSVNLKIGLSATPFLQSESPLVVENIIGSVIASISYSQLIQEGFLLTPQIYMYKLPRSKSKGAYQTIYKADVVENVFLDGLIKKIVSRIVAAKQSVVIQTEYINHSIKLGKLLDCEVLTGKDTAEKRQSIMNRLKSKEILCVVSTLFEEGIDIPSLSYTVNAAGGLSNISTLQRMRSITVNENKSTCGIIDFFHQSKYLKNHSEQRKLLYESEPEFKLKFIDVSKKALEEIN